MSVPYYQDDRVTLYHADCREMTTWRNADVLVTDPPYGRGWVSGQGMTNSEGRGRGSKPHGGIAGDKDTTTRDEAIELWTGPGIVFGDLLIPPPAGAVQTLIYAKAADSGVKGARAGFRRDVEAIYLIGEWPAGVGGRSSILRSNSWVAGPTSPAYRYGHPHAKPVDLLEQLVELASPAAVIADPFAGSGTTLVAARNTGRRAIGAEVDERYCELIAKRLDQMCLDFGSAS